MNSIGCYTIADGSRDDHNDTTDTTLLMENVVVSSCRSGRCVSRRLAVSLIAVVAVVSLSACATTKAAMPVDRPALMVPPPPPRVITPMPLPEVQPAPEPLELPANTSKPPSRPPRPQNQASKDAGKTDPKIDPLPEAPANPPVATPPPVTPQLRMPEGNDAAATARQARDTIERTRRVLKGIDPARLSSVLQKALTDAKAFTTQAEEALNAGNVVFAKELAEKAERLAKELQGR